MPEADTNLPGGIYCRQCGYDLRSRPAPHRCPECGRTFDPSNRKTFLTRPPCWAVWRWTKRVAILMLTVIFLLAMWCGWLYWDWKNEQVAVEKMSAEVRIVEPLGGDGLRRSLESVGWVLDLANHVELKRATDADLIYLKELKWLKRLSLYDTPVTDAGLVHLKELKELRTLSLSNTRVTDAGLVHLKELKGLWELSLIDTPVTDAGLVHLKERKGLLRLFLQNTKVTDEGVEKLHASLRLTNIVH